MQREPRTKSIRRAAAWALAVAMSASAGGRAAEAPAWPETRAGEVAKGWVAAFDAGEPAMRSFLAENLSAASLAKKDVAARLDGYRKLREMLGTLALASVVEEGDGLLVVMLADAEGREHEFEFELEREAPQKLTTITGRLQMPGHGHGLPH